MPKLFITPSFNEDHDNGDGGIRRVVEAQRKHLPDYGYTIVDTPDEADIIACHAGTSVRGLPHIPRVAHCHGLYWNDYEWPLWAHEMNKDVINVIHDADAVTAPSEWVANAIRRGTLIDPDVLYHGIDLDDWPYQAERMKYLLWNKTRVDPVCSIEPVNELAQLAPQYDIISTYGKDQFPNLKVTGRLPFSDAKSLIQNAGLYLCTSRETFGIGTLEAMASGVPVVGWNFGGQAEFIEHGVDGWLSNPGDYDDLLKGIRYCFTNMSSMSAAARRKVVSSYTWKHRIKAYAALYDRVLARTEGPKVSVIITNYKLEQYLRGAVVSAINACAPDTKTEIIIVDDASPTWNDDIVNIPVPEHVKIKVIHNESNLYLAGALNEGIRQASGDYIVPLDADNELGNGAIAVLADALDNDRSIDIVYGAMQVIEEDGSDFIAGWPGEFSFTEQMKHRNQCPSTSMYRKRVWQRIGGYRIRCRTAEDADFWTRATSYGAKPKRVTDAVTLIYRNRADSMSHKEPDWDWTAWHAHSRMPELTPFGADPKHVQSYDPPIISVVVPVGPSHGQYIIDVIDSVMAQTFQKWELLLVNDSGDELPWVPPFVRVLSTPKVASGPAVARNIGIAAAKAPTFVLLDADDMLQPKALEIMLDAYKAMGGYVYTDWKVKETDKVYHTPEFNVEEIKRHLPHAVTCLYSKADWAKLGGFDETIEAWEDWDFILGLCSIGVCGVRVPQPLFTYRVTTGHRREQLYANRDVLKQQIFDKWFAGEDKMACSSCSQKRTFTGVAHNTPTDTSDLVLLEFTGSGGTQTYRGKATGAQYRFGPDPAHRLKYVKKADAEHLLTLPVFKVPDEQLVTA